MTKDAELHYPAKNFLKDIWRFIKPRRGSFFLATALRLSGDLALLYPTYAFAEIVNLLTTPHPDLLRPFFRLILLWAAAGAWRYIGANYGKYIGFQVAERGSMDLGITIIRHLTRLDASWHEKHGSGNKLKRIQRAVDALDDVVKIWLGNVIEIIVNFIGMLLIVAHANTNIGLALLLFIATYTPLSFILLRRAARVSRAVNLQEEHVHGLLFEVLNNIRSVKLMGIAPNLLEKLRLRIARLMELTILRIRRFQSRGSFLGIYAEIFRVAVTGIIGYGIIRGYYQLGFLVLFNGYFSNLRTSAEELSGISESIITDKYNLARGMEILEEPVEIDSEKNKVPFPTNWETITIRGLSFSYGDNAVLRDLSFSIARGEKVGIVGLSGAGKSTLFKLFLKEYEPHVGDIFYDEVPLSSIEKLNYLDHVAVVLQETEVFNFSLRENITIARKNNATEEEVAEALAVAHVTDFVHKLPDGIDTLIGEKGIRLSGGEKQRLGIARAIIKKPQILFLDEATSHLDLESEEKIQDSLGRFFETVTAVVIAHRLTTLRKMDRILVLEDGAIVESGSFEELQERRGRFFDLWEKQRL
jgi:ATP-binding cassette, subfamily B, bacterial